MNILSSDILFLIKTIDTDHYIFYLYLHKFKIDNIFSNTHISIIEDKICNKQSSKGQFCLDKFLNSVKKLGLPLVSRNYLGIITVMSQSIIWFSRKRGFLGTNMLI